jgi:AraC-like DNA-binding protein
MGHLHELRTLVEGHGREGATETAVTGLTLYVETDPSVVAYVVHRPVLALILGGAKRTVLGGRVFDIRPGDYVAVSIDLPATGQVTRAPYSAVTLDLDLDVLAELISEPRAAAWGVAAGVEVNRAGPDLLDAMLRLLKLLDRQEDIAVLAPMIRREVFWRVLQSPCGAMVRQIALADSRLSQVSRAVTWLRTNYAKPVRIERLAEMARMSPASFHRHFKAATAMSPVQYQKQIRLQTARARLLAQQGDVAGVGFSVGYESPSQFSREYARLFGAPPARDAARFREAREAAGAEA